MSTEPGGGLFSLRGKVALVGGASRGIGEAIARGLAASGATVVGLGRSKAPAGCVFDYRRCDVTRPRAFRKVCGDLAAKHGGLDIYVHAAGITLPDPSGRQTPEDFRRSLEVNLVAAYACGMAVAERMTRGGAIIHITSIGSLLGFPGNPGYVSSKGGLRLLTRAMALDLGSRRIRVNNIAPGYIRTAMTEASFRDRARRREREKRTILGRWGTPEDLVGAAVFLASDASSYITGQDLIVDGGWTAKGL